MLPLLLGAGRSRWHCAVVLSCTTEHQNTHVIVSVPRKAPLVQRDGSKFHVGTLAVCKGFLDLISLLDKNTIWFILEELELELEGK